MTPLNTADVFRDVSSFQRHVLGVQRPKSVVPLEQTPGAETTVAGLQEEYDELTHAMNEKDVAGQIDALIDLIYFALGGLYQMGVDFSAAWACVHTANMKKVLGETKRGTVCDAAKPEDWTPPDLSAVANAVAEAAPKRQVAEAQLFYDTSPTLFIKAAALLQKKRQDYRSGIPLVEYFPYGHKSYQQMLHTKKLRIDSLVKVIESGGTPNFESLSDTLVDLANYAAFYYAFVNGIDAELEAKE